MASRGASMSTLPPGAIAKSGERERQRGDAGSERPPVAMEEQGQDRLAALLLLVPSERPGCALGRSLRHGTCRDSRGPVIEPVPMSWMPSRFL